MRYLIRKIQLWLHLRVFRYNYLRGYIGLEKMYITKTPYV